MMSPPLFTSCNALLPRGRCACGLAELVLRPLLAEELPPGFAAQGYKPRNSRVCRMRWQATMNVAVRRLTFFS